MEIDLLVEGPVDSLVGGKILLSLEMTPGTIFGEQGHGYIIKNAQGFANRTLPILILIDSMDVNVCPPRIPEMLTPYKREKCLVRGVSQEIESWIMADRQNLASYLGISVSLIPQNPDELQDPKSKFLELCSKAKSRKKRNALVRIVNGNRYCGPGYLTGVSEIMSNWDLQQARLSSPSLNKCALRLKEHFS